MGRVELAPALASLSSWAGRSPRKCGDSFRCLRSQTPNGVPTLWALLSPGNLWYRQGVTPSYPQGSSWEHVSNNVCRVSVGPLDQVWVLRVGGPGAEGGRLLWGFGVLRVPALVSACRARSPTGDGGWTLAGSVFQVWIIANKVPGSRSMSRGTVCHRTGVQPREPMGQGWDYGIGVSKAMWGGLPGWGWRGHTACSGTCCQVGWEAPDRANQGSLISCSLEAWSLPLTPDSHG